MQTSRLIHSIVLLPIFTSCGDSSKCYRSFEWSNGSNSEKIDLFNNGTFEYFNFSDLVILKDGYSTTHFSGTYLQTNSVLVFLIKRKHMSKKIGGIYTRNKIEDVTQDKSEQAINKLFMISYEGRQILTTNPSINPSILDSALFANVWNRPKRVFVGR